ncbi:TetR/AcrR family transcriptional regulator [Saccharopolyspora phatthalungensis]|uniref:AcrR family transcriptional regulator n=1 Tax=Saccharopolyspora phatthalungensis TaxID=664693 RepID=A0A840QH67_9PSEU|nr:TetR/AcrR family transcriptional regulator [Saccharopolyspora phatthalungensis]MBB5158118.1 AcrR family transcriptional regulator [Saccharopolyspora phatthalungensis]
MTTDATPRLRADARRNRDRIIAAARTVFTERGTEVPMEEIARAAGVGTGTLYRRFPDRDSLISAVGQDVFQRVLEEARAIGGRDCDPWRALTDFLLRAADLRTVVRFSMLSQRARKILGADPEVEQARNELLDILDGLVLAAQANGSLRPDVSSGDLGVILSIVLQGVHSAPDDIRSEAPARYLTLMLDGLQARPGTPLPGRPVTAADIAVVRGAQR